MARLGFILRVGGVGRCLVSSVSRRRFGGTVAFRVGVA